MMALVLIGCAAFIGGCILYATRTLPRAFGSYASADRALLWNELTILRREVQELRERTQVAVAETKRNGKVA